MNIDKLKQIVANDAAGVQSYVTAADGKPLLDAKLIEVNTELTNPADANEVACRSTDAGKAQAANSAQPEVTQKSHGNYAIITGAALPPPKKRGNSSGSGAPTKYPFADLPVGGSFFSANTEHAKGDAVKALGSTVSAQNDKYSEASGEVKTVTRAVRDPQTKKAKLEAVQSP